jgi:N-methylhydantoinase A
MAIRIGIDTGGTFTDLCMLDGRGMRIHKVPSATDDPARAVLDGIRGLDVPGAQLDIVHGTTVGLNAVLTGRTARTAFVTNRGFEDLIEIGRQARRSLYDLGAPKPFPPVPRALRLGIAQRRSADGAQLAAPARAELDALRERLRRARIESVAIGLLHAYRNPEDERAVARALAPLGVPITCSAELLPTLGEYERFCAAILNAAIAPVMGAYLDRLRTAIAPGRLRLMRSSAGIMDGAEAGRFPARAAFSGPAGGVHAARQCAAQLRLGTVAALDLGGTSADVSLVRATPATTDRATLAGLPLAIPAVDVHTIGCGGGSLATVDAGGALRVGPQSAGADPGPACYGRDERPTLTDAHMVLGHMGADTLLGGAFPVDPDRSVHALEKLARRLRLDLRRTAEGILEIAEVAMVRALMVITVERAVDPAGLSLIAFGGAGGLHAARVADRLGMARAVVPTAPGAFSAVGLALAGESAESIVPVLQPLDALDLRARTAFARSCAAAARAQLGAAGRRARVDVAALLRFRGQGNAVRVPFTRDLGAAFRRSHQRLYGFTPEAGMELVEVQARAERAGPDPSPAPSRGRSRPGRPPPGQPRRAPCGGAPWPVLARASLSAGQRLAGPCLVEEPTGVTLVPGGWRCRVTPQALVLDRGDPPSG